MSNPETEGAATAALSEGAITREAGRIGAATLLSRTLGLVRDMQFAALFGTSRVADAFNLAFLLPNTLRMALGEGAVRSAFVPVISEVMTRESPARARQLAARTVSFWALVLLAVSAAGVLVASPMVRIYAWGWRSDADTLGLAIRLSQFLFPFIFVAGMTALLGGVLNAYNRYGVPAMAPVAYNVLCIATAFLLCPRMSGGMQVSIWGFAAGTMAGGLAGLLIHLPSMRRLGVGLDRSGGARDPAVRRMGALLVPAVLGLAVYQVNALVDTLVATHLAEGSVTALRLSQRVTMLPLGVFGMAVNTAALPSLAALASAGDRARVRSTLGFSLRVTYAVMAPTALGILLLSSPIVRLLFERGAFLHDLSTPLTARALFYSALGLPAIAMIKGLAQAFYAYQDTRTPFGVGIVCMVVNVILNLLLMRPLGVGGLALATSLAGVLNMMLLVALLPRKTGPFEWRKAAPPAVRLTGLALAACVPARLLHDRLLAGAAATGAHAEIIPMLAAIAAAGLVYAGLAVLTRTREVTVIWESHREHRNGGKR